MDASEYQFTFPTTRPASNPSSAADASATSQRQPPYPADSDVSLDGSGSLNPETLSLTGDMDPHLLQTYQPRPRASPPSSSKFSILTKFLSVLEFGVDIGAEIDRSVSDERTFVFDTLETTQFTPTASYVQTWVEAKNVRHFLELSKYRRPVYIITGLKVVTGAQVNTIKCRSVGGAVVVEVDATV
ncbi:hypothetical protein AK830_g1617 [Neonectria ditissima]|uniref:Uncharacterized protein n=1 Tax=Neonectria ditissima TaxID=78410 RepID=A0A0P7BYP0_9HYPO|nr:hypothetical protein AK830_g1617 [Neonectria ditissima]